MTAAHITHTSPTRHYAPSASASAFARTPHRHSRAHSFANQSITTSGWPSSVQIPHAAMGGDYAPPLTGGYATGPSTTVGGVAGDRETQCLLELQRVLYRGSGYYDENGVERDEVDEIEVQRFIEECLEMDCVYDSPLISYPNRPLLLSSHLLTSSLFSLVLPSVRLHSLIGHSRNLKGWAWRRLREAVIGVEEANRKAVEEREGKRKEAVGLAKIERSITTTTTALERQRQIATGSQLGEPLRLMNDSRRTGLSFLDQDDEDHGLTLTSARSMSRSRSAVPEMETQALASEEKAQKEEEDEDEDLWWHPWEIKSECGEMGTMDCYDGFHVGFIEQAITIDFLPHWLPPRITSESAASPTAPSSPNVFTTASQSQFHLSPPYRPTYRHAAPPTSIPSAIFQALTASFLRHSVRVTTIVHFNEAGKITYIRDSVDVRDLVESLIPLGFGRGLGWVGRRLAGFALAGAGGLWSGARAKVKDTLGLPVDDVDVQRVDVGPEAVRRMMAAPTYRIVNRRRSSGETRSQEETVDPPVSCLGLMTTDKEEVLEMAPGQASNSSGKGSSAPDIDEGPAE